MATATAAAATAAALKSDTTKESPIPTDYIPPKSNSDSISDEVEACIQEAEVLLAYGLTDQAGDLLSDMLNKYPERIDLRSRLTRLWGEAGEKEKFISEAEQLKERLEEDNPAWTEIEQLGRQCCPEHPLFGGEGSLASEPDETTFNEVEFEAFDETFGAQSTSQAASSDLSFDEVNFEDVEQEKDTQAIDTKEVETPDEFAPLEIDLSSKPAAEAEPLGMEEGTLETLEPLDLDIGVDANEKPAVETSTLENRGEPDLEQETSELSVEPFELPEETKTENTAKPESVDDDEILTKLGLAEAFIELGDNDGARMMLEEVMQAGGSQSEKAKELLAKIS